MGRYPRRRKRTNSKRKKPVEKIPLSKCFSARFSFLLQESWCSQLTQLTRGGERKENDGLTSKTRAVQFFSLTFLHSIYSTISLWRRIRGTSFFKKKAPPSLSLIEMSGCASSFSPLSLFLPLGLRDAGALTLLSRKIERERSRVRPIGDREERQRRRRKTAGCLLYKRELLAFFTSGGHLMLCNNCWKQMLLWRLSNISRNGKSFVWY